MLVYCDIVSSCQCSLNSSLLGLEKFGTTITKISVLLMHYCSCIISCLAVLMIADCKGS